MASFLFDVLVRNQNCTQIVRDFCLASHTSVQLRQLQRSFVSTLLSKVDDKKEQDENELVEWNKYAAKDLSYHVADVLQTPYAKDELARRVLVHKDEGIAMQAVSVSQRADADAFSTHLFDTKSFWTAAILAKNLSTRVGLSVDERCSYMFSALGALEHVPKESQPGSLGMQLRLSGK